MKPPILLLSLLPLFARPAGAQVNFVRDVRPISEMPGDYASVLMLTKEYFDAKGERVCAKLFHEIATSFYGITSSNKQRGRTF